MLENDEVRECSSSPPRLYKQVTRAQQECGKTSYYVFQIQLKSPQSVHGLASPRGQLQVRNGKQIPHGNCPMLRIHVRSYLPFECAGLAGLAVGHPFGHYNLCLALPTVKVRLQSRNISGRYKGTWNCFTTIIRQEKGCIKAWPLK
ncbi:hypothetical protein BC937DRAFT_89737 [Endogone sp. FLAS-F59071]|nr:hypothetical protein BC937DRAFT_89737 [Endogone sp. FLAS-F59071]|eukprot:RUS22309.1 hypothetical protein BC937DRAFT_89737 [Endogone sp. FLAS-F59071]